MGWLKLKELDMKESRIRKLMSIYRQYDEMFMEENFKLFNDDLKRKLEASKKIDITMKLEEYKKNKVRIIDANNPCYPARLKEIADYPLFLYVKGGSHFFEKRTEGRYSKDLNTKRKNIAVVGTRRVTKFGRSACEKIVRELLPYDVTLISGLAEGIDTVALSTAVGKDGKVIAVVGSGLDVVYPYENKMLWEKISESGILISEHPLGTKPLKWNFPKRNRIIAGLSDGILIAESFKSGGALITAELGFSMDREIFAVPGFINYPSFEGCNMLIKENKAKLVTCAEDIAKEFLWDIREEKSILYRLTEEEKLALSQLDEEEGLEELVERTGIPVSSLLSILMKLKLKGLITETGASRYIRII